MRARPAILVLCLLGAVAVAPAQAQTQIAPPGKSGADQYFETVPSARGNVAPPRANIGRAKTGSAGERRLAQLGKDGQAAAALAAAGAPRGEHARGGATKSTAGSSSASLGRLIGGSDSGGIGTWLPILLGISLLGAILFALTRRRDPEAF